MNAKVSKNNVRLRKEKIYNNLPDLVYQNRITPNTIKFQMV